MSSNNFENEIDFEIDNKKMQTIELAKDNSQSNSEGKDEPHANLDNIRKSSPGKAGVTLLKAFIGTGILALPHTYKEAGLGLAIVSTAVIGLISYYTMSLIIDVANRLEKKDASLSFVARHVLGAWGSHSVSFSIVCMQIACCISYLIFINKFFSFVSCEFNIGWLCGAKAIYIAFSFVIIFPLVLLNSVHYLFIPSILANIIVFVTIIAQLFYDVNLVNHDPTRETAIKSHLAEFNMAKIPLFFGIVVYAFEGIAVILTIRASLPDPNKFKPILRLVMTILTVIYTLFGSISYLTYGANTQEIIFFNFPVNATQFLVLEVFYSIALIFTFPLQLFPAIKVLEHSRLLRKRLYLGPGKVNKPLRYLIRLVIVAIIFVIAFSVPSFALFLNLIGAVLFTLITFIIPIFIYNSYFKAEITCKRKFFNLFVLAVGVVAGGFGLVFTLKEMIAPKTEGEL